MSDIASPSLLQAPPKRGPGVKRLNSIPMIIACGVAVVGVSAVAYTAIHRHNLQNQQAAHEAETKPVEGGKPPAFLLQKQGHGEVQAMLDNQLSRPNMAPPKVSSPASTKPTPTPAAAAIADNSGSDVTEQARLKAWQTYYSERDQLAAQRFSMDMQALTGGGNGQGLGQSNGGLQAGGSGGPTLPQVAQTAGAGIGSGTGDSQYSTGGTDPKGQSGKQAFLHTAGDPYGLNEDLEGGTHKPKPDTLMEGTAIPAHMIDGAISDQPGQIVAEVDRNICDSMTGNDLLIPHGSQLIGQYDIAVSAGQDRLGVIWNRVIFPDTSSRQIGSMEGADQEGNAGFHDLVNTHFWEKFGSALVISLVGAGAQLAQPQQSAFSGYSPSSVAAGQMTQQFQQLGQSYAQQGLSVPNTLQIRHGYQFTVKMNKDVFFRPYTDARGYSYGTGACS